MGAPDWEGLLYIVATGLATIAVEWVRRKVLGSTKRDDEAGNDTHTGA